LKLYPQNFLDVLGNLDDDWVRQVNDLGSTHNMEYDRLAIGQRETDMNLVT